MAKQTFTTGQVLTAAQMTALQANDYNWTVSAKTASYVLAAADAGTRITMNSASATTITVNTALFTAGDTVFIQNIGSGACVITAGTATVTTSGSLTLSQWDGGTLYFTTAGAAIYLPSGKASKILQVQSVFKADTFSLTSTSFVDITGLSVSITPSSASSTIICMGQLNTSTSGTEYLIAQIVRGATAVGSGTGGSTYNGITVNPSGVTSQMWTQPFSFVDSPATTSATTYKLQIRSSSTVAAYVNRRTSDTLFGGSSNLILMEVAP